MLKKFFKGKTKYVVVSSILGCLVLSMIILLNELAIRQSANSDGSVTSGVYDDMWLYNVDDSIANYVETAETNSQGIMNEIGHIGQLKIENTEINYPIMYSADLTYYTQHNSDNRADANGAIFLDARVTSTDEMVLLIHGLTVEDGKMFSELWNYQRSDWALSHDTLYTTFHEVTRSYKLFCVVEFTQEDPVVHLNCDSDKELEAFYNDLCAKSRVNIESTFDADKQLVLLNTMNVDKYILVGFMEE